MAGRSPFRKIRFITDGALARALMSHKGGIDMLLKAHARNRVLRFVRWAWMIAMTLALMNLYGVTVR